MAWDQLYHVSKRDPGALSQLLAAVIAESLDLTDTEGSTADVIDTSQTQGLFNGFRNM